ncbi:MAG: hypothetical protein ACI350_00920 [Prevotella sp.]
MEKQNVQTLTALIVLATGMALSAISFFMPPEGVIEASVLNYFAQTLMFAGAVFGLKSYVDKELKR